MSCKNAGNSKEKIKFGARKEVANCMQKLVLHLESFDEAAEDGKRIAEVEANEDRKVEVNPPLYSLPKAWGCLAQLDPGSNEQAKKELGLLGARRLKDSEERGMEHSVVGH
ncbi:hypothetical protein R1flu_028294 [Riccia fluitans]|uniref:Uncharacterized protein n=1 Tax=Riccia fluitans TaxID=41844 RepID=A0ABD1XP44_9MARC